VKDYSLRTLWLDAGHPHMIEVCATDAIEAISEAWKKLPSNRLNSVDTFEVVSIHACQHEKGRVV